MVLEGGPRHGYALMKRVGEHLGDTGLGPGTLYRLLKELREAGLIEAVAAPPGEVDARRQYHALTRLGRDVARLEAERLAGLLSQAGLAALLSRREG
jgi:DNA-binding PadR family transcriptional regulator